MSQNHIDIQRVVVQSRAASMTALDRLGPSLTGRIRISTVICYASMHVEHINPNGGDDPENLCLVCPTCNLSKARATSALDPITGMIVPLFHPRRQQWQEHFRWIENARRVQGLTPTGRATVERLRMNQEQLVVARALWVKAHCHPPSFDA
jgi:5-methylcytosine-specific restriction endonuclease McrA